MSVSSSKEKENKPRVTFVDVGNNYFNDADGCKAQDISASQKIELGIVVDVY